jgi:hypothetical protein
MIPGKGFSPDYMQLARPARASGHQKRSSFVDQIRAIGGNKMSSNNLNDLAEVCSNFLARKKKTFSAKILCDLAEQNLPEPVQQFCSILIDSASGLISATAAETKEIQTIGHDRDRPRNGISVKEAVDIVIRYQPVRRVQDHFSYTEHGVRTRWQQDNSQIAEALGDFVSEEDVSLARRILALDWLEKSQLRSPTEEQLEFIIDSYHSIRVTARAGSGKTETVATKILFLLHYVGIAQYHILALVFNVEARDDLIQRIRDLENKAGFSTKGPYAVMNFDRLARGVVQPQANILKGSELSKKIKELVYLFLSEKNENSELIQQFMLTSFQADWNK